MPTEVLLDKAKYFLFNPIHVQKGSAGYYYICARKNAPLVKATT